MDSSEQARYPAVRPANRSLVVRLLAGLLLVAVSPFVVVGQTNRPAEILQGAQAANVMWRYDGAGRFPAIDPPSEWRGDKNVVWKAAVETGGYSSPIVVGDKIFLTAEMGSLLCLSLADGKILWQKDLFSTDSPEIPKEMSAKLMRGCGGDSKQSTPTPTSNGELVFCINAMGLSACYDLHGNRRWIRIIETAADEESFSASPIFLGNRILVHWGCLLALDANDGHTLWKADDALPTYGTPAITTIGGVEMAVTPGGDIVRLSDGEILCSGLFKSTYTTPVVDEGVMYVVDKQAMALKLPAKAEPGMRLTEIWKTKLSGVFMASPLLNKGLLHTIESKHCRLFTLDAKSGELLTVSRSIDPESKLEKEEGGVSVAGLASSKFTYASPAASPKELFFFDDSGRAAIVEPGRNGRLKHINPLDDGCVGTPFFIGKKIIIRGNKSVTCIGAK